MMLPPSRARDDLRAYHFRLGCAALLATPSQVPLLVIAHAFGISSLPMMLMLVLGYYPLCWMLLLSCHPARSRPAPDW